MRRLPHRSARHRPGEAGLHAARVLGRRPGCSGLRPRRLRPRRPHEPTEDAAGRRAVWRLRHFPGDGCDPDRAEHPGGIVDLIHPMDKVEVAEALRQATADGRRLLVVGGRTHIDKGEPCAVDAEPAEMIAVVEGGMRVGELDRILADGAQEWPSDAPTSATVGGVIAAAVTSPRRLRMGPIRDTVIEMEVVTGDGRLVRSGARTVKSVTGYDLHKLMTGSLGTLGVIVQVALKV